LNKAEPPENAGGFFLFDKVKLSAVGKRPYDLAASSGQTVKRRVCRGKYEHFFFPKAGFMGI
jgi:hypothetical protein